MEIGRRCKAGCATWPDLDEYLDCPVCEEPTRRFRGLTPLSESAATSRRKHAEFDRFYIEEWVPDTSPDDDDELLSRAFVEPSTTCSDSC